MHFHTIDLLVLFNELTSVACSIEPLRVSIATIQSLELRLLALVLWYEVQGRTNLLSVLNRFSVLVTPIEDVVTEKKYV
jgi:hypothetical protein